MKRRISKAPLGVALWALHHPVAHTIAQSGEQPWTTEEPWQLLKHLHPMSLSSTTWLARGAIGGQADGLQQTMSGIAPKTYARLRVSFVSEVAPAELSLDIARVGFDQSVVGTK